MRLYGEWHILCTLQIANVSSGAGSLAGKVKFVEDAEIRKTLPYAVQALAYKQSKVSVYHSHMCIAAQV